MLTGVVGPATAQAVVVINGESLSPRLLEQLRTEGLALSSGRYWYDPVSGWWGGEGGPSAGQWPPGLALGGSLHADASGRGTGAFINGRELHPVEVEQLALLLNAPVPQLRFWMNAQGIGGPEGGPSTFSLQAAAQAFRQAQSGASLRRGVFGTTGGDGNSFFFNDLSTGASVMTGD